MSSLSPSCISSPSFILWFIILSLSISSLYLYSLLISRLYLSSGDIYGKNGKILYIGDYLLDQRKGSEKLKQYKELDFLIFFHDSSKLGLHNSTIGLRSSESDWHFHESKNIDLKKLKGKGKELDQYCNLIYEGVYLNGKRNGKGIECYRGILIFEGEFLNGKRNGKGKKFDFFGSLNFEGEYLNGEKNGKGKEYDKKGKLIFEGEYLNDKPWNGKGYDEKENIIYNLRSHNLRRRRCPVIRHRIPCRQQQHFLFRH